MSEKKSWDVQPKARPHVRPAPPERRNVPIDSMRRVQRPAPVRALIRAPRQSAPPPSGRLRERRKKARKTGLIVLVIFFVLLAGALLYAVWLPALRIQEVQVTGTSADGVEAVARASLAGRYAYVIPRNSVFFFPKDLMRESVLRAHPEISALSIERASFTSLKLTGTSRAQAFIWCGVSLTDEIPDGLCYDTDAEGFIYKPANVSTSTTVLSTGSSTPPTAGDLRIYSSLDRELAEGESPVGLHVTRAAAIPNALRFVKAVRGLGIPVTALALRNDEADLWISDSTRITYVLGREDEAAQLAASVMPTLHITDGTIEYLDLRFKGKAYVKRHGQ